MHRRVGSCSRNEQGSSLLPRNMGGTTNQMVGLDSNQFGMTGPIVRESDDLVADRDVPDRASDCLDDAGKVAALSRGECRGPLLGEGTLADWASPGLMPAAFIPMRTCCGPGTGRSTSTTRRTSVPPYLSNFTARGIGSLLVTVAAITRSHDPEAPFASRCRRVSAVRLSATLELGWRASRPTPEGLAEGDLGTDRGPLEMPPRQKCKRPGGKFPGPVFARPLGG